MKGKIPVSVAIVACNEEKRIEQCLDSVKEFEEVVLIIDTKTTDRTAELAHRYDCRIFHEDWKGYGPQKQSAVDKCRNDWVFILDSDEKLPPETVAGIRQIMENTVEIAYRMPRKNFLHGRWMRHADYWPDWQTRLVDRRFGKISVNAVHDRWVLNEGYAARQIDLPIEHFSFDGYKDMLKAMDSHSSYIAQDLFRNGRASVSPLSPFYHGAWMFFKIYFLKRGLLEGFDGFVTALVKAGGSFFKYAKLLELKRFGAGPQTDTKHKGK